MIAFEGGFHGRTLLSLSLTSKTHPYKAGLGPFAPEIYRVPFAQDYRGPNAQTALEVLERMLITHVAAENVAAIVIESRPGRGRLRRRAAAFMEGVRRICDEHGIVMVVDEVQTGFARTGRMWAIEHYDVEPDLITIAKSIAAGLPLSGVLGKAEIMDAPGDAAIGGTYVGNPVAQAAALAVLDVIEDEGLIDRARRDRRDDPGAHAGAGRSAATTIGDVRGLGAMLAIELVHDRDTKNPAPELASAVVEAAAERGLLLLKSGIYSNCIRVLVPLVISDAELDEALDVWDEAVDVRRGRLALAASRRENYAPCVVGELIAGRYELEELVGSGGMSSVYRAHDRLLERHGRAEDPARAVRRRRRVRSSASAARPAPSRSSRTRTSSPSSTAARRTGRQYIVFEYVGGENLKQLVEREGPLPVPRP